MLILIFLRLSLPHSLVMINLFSISMTWLYFCFVNKFICIPPPFFLTPHISDSLMICVSDFTQYNKQSLGLSLLLQMALFCSFLWLNSIPLYICTVSCLSIPLLMDIYVASMSWLLNIGVRVSFWIMFFSGYMPRSGIARSYGSSIFSF